MDSPLAKRFFITENLPVHDEDGEESEKSFFAECKHKHGPHGN